MALIYTEGSQLRKKASRLSVLFILWLLENSEVTPSTSRHNDGKKQVKKLLILGAQGLHVIRRWRSCPGQDTIAASVCLCSQGVSQPSLSCGALAVNEVKQLVWVVLGLGICSSEGATSPVKNSTTDIHRNACCCEAKWLQDDMCCFCANTSLMLKKPFDHSDLL